MKFTISATQATVKTSGLYTSILGIVVIISGVVFLNKDLIIAGVLSAVGLAFLFGASWVTTTINTLGQTVTKKTVRLIGKKVMTSTFNEIQKVIVQEMSSQGKSGKLTGYELFFEAKEVRLDQPFILASSSRSNISFLNNLALKKYRGVGQQIASMMGIPYEERNAPTWHDAMKMIKGVYDNQQKNKVE